MTRRIGTYVTSTASLAVRLAAFAAAPTIAHAQEGRDTAVLRQARADARAELRTVLPEGHRVLDTEAALTRDHLRCADTPSVRRGAHSAGCRLEGSEAVHILDPVTVIRSDSATVRIRSWSRLSSGGVSYSAVTWALKLVGGRWRKVGEFGFEDS